MSQGSKEDPIVITDAESKGKNSETDLTRVLIFSLLLYCQPTPPIQRAPPSPPVPDLEDGDDPVYHQELQQKQQQRVQSGEARKQRKESKDED